MSVTVYRVQDKRGRGPWKPGFSEKWVIGGEKPLLSPFEMDIALKLAGTAKNTGFGCLSLEDLREWILEEEYVFLKKRGFRAVKMVADKILYESEKQVVFEKRRPLNKDCLVVNLWR